MTKGSTMPAAAEERRAAEGSTLPAASINFANGSTMPAIANKNKMDTGRYDADGSGAAAAALATEGGAALSDAPGGVDRGATQEGTEDFASIAKVKAYFADAAPTTERQGKRSWRKLAG